MSKKEGRERTVWRSLSPSYEIWYWISWYLCNRMIYRGYHKYGTISTYSYLWVIPIFVHTNLKI